MKKKIILSIAFVAVAAIAFLAGTIQIKTDEASTSTDESNEHIVDMQEVTDFESSENGLYIYFEDGTGYYWER